MKNGSPRSRAIQPVERPSGQRAPTEAAAPPAPRGLSGRIWTRLHRHAWTRTLRARRFVVVGALNTSVDYVLFVGLTKILHLSLDWVWVAKLMSGTVAMTISFLLNRNWVFGARGGAGMRQAARFVAATAVGVYGVQTPLTQLFAGVYQAPGRAFYAVLRDLGLAQAFPSVVTEALATKTAAFALATCLSMTFNFLAYHFWVFRPSAAQRLSSEGAAAETSAGA
jgi:putative flippase GtrA